MLLVCVSGMVNTLVAHELYQTAGRCDWLGEVGVADVCTVIPVRRIYATIARLSRMAMVEQARWDAWCGHSAAVAIIVVRMRSHTDVQVAGMLRNVIVWKTEVLQHNKRYAVRRSQRLCLRMTFT